MKKIAEAQGAQSPFPDKKSRETTRELKRQAVLLAAVRMFNEHGYHSTSLDDVAGRLGITKPVIYHYFGNKDQVLLACVRAGVDQLIEAAQQCRKERGSGLDRLRLFLCRYAEINMVDFGRCVILTGDESLSPESRAAFRLIKREVDLSLRQMIEEGVADGSLQVDDIRIAAFALAGALNWPARWRKDDGPLSVEEISQQLVNFLVQGLSPR